MKTKTSRIIVLLVLLLSAIWLFIGTQNQIENSPEDIKVALRDVGHNLLLTNNDSLSLVLPVKQLDASSYELQFENEISIQPDSLVNIIKRSVQKSNLSKRYIVEVMQCADGEIAYSYKVRNESEKSIIPCGTRPLPMACYTIGVHFLNTNGGLLNRNLLLVLILLLSLSLLWLVFRKDGTKSRGGGNEHKIALGNYLFYPNQNKLELKRKEIQLSKKEGELLAMLALHQNQIVKREDLAKVWEDDGVIVGRSLDTYISKLRKRLDGDGTIKLTNIHGVGYKLEIN